MHSVASHASIISMWLMTDQMMAQPKSGEGSESNNE
jgi:hypothetical protein